MQTGALQVYGDYGDAFVQKIRCEQGSNLRGKIPLDFKSNALTTRPSQHTNCSMKIYAFYDRCRGRKAIVKSPPLDGSRLLKQVADGRNTWTTAFTHKLNLISEGIDVLDENFLAVGRIRTCAGRAQ